MANKNNEVPFYLQKPQVRIAGLNAGYGQNGMGRNIAEKSRELSKNRAKLVVKGTEEAVKREKKKASDKLKTNQRLVKKHNIGYDPDKVRLVLEELIAAGYDIGKTGVDGDWGRKTLKAWDKYLKSKNKPQSNLDVQASPEQILQIAATFPGKAVDRNGNMTKECAAYVHNVLKSNTKNTTWGNSYNIINGNGLPFVVNGYDNLSLPNNNTKSIHNFNKLAADKLALNLDVSQLNTNHLYIVNMYYSNRRGPSSHTQDFYNNALKENSKTYGTHTGIMYFSPEKNQWRINHNIHGVIHDESLEDDLGSKAKYGFGVTAVGDAGSIVDPNYRWYNPFTW